MKAKDKVILKSLIVMAWADGKVVEEELDLIDELIASFGAEEEEALELKEYASTPKKLDDIDVTTLELPSRRRLLEFAVMLSFADGVQDETELQLLHDLADRLEIVDGERDTLLRDASMRARGLLQMMHNLRP